MPNFSGWRVPYVFEDSPTCLNFDDAAQSHPCTECPLMEFVPRQFRGQSAPCRFIALTEAGETIDYFYQAGTPMELEDALACWLHKQIERMATSQTTPTGQRQVGRTNVRSGQLESSGRYGDGRYGPQWREMYREEESDDEE